MRKRRFGSDQIPAREQGRADLRVRNPSVQQIYGLNLTARSTGLLLGLVPSAQPAQDLGLVNATIAWKTTLLAVRGPGCDAVDPLGGTLEITDVDQCLQALTEHLRGRDWFKLVGGQERQRLVKQRQTVGCRSASDKHRTLQRH